MERFALKETVIMSTNGTKHDERTNMSESKLHPLDKASASATSLPSVIQPVRPTSPGTNLTFRETVKSKDSVGASPDLGSSSASQLRNRMDSKPMLSLPATSDLNSSVVANTSSLSNATSAAVGVGGAGNNSTNDPPKPVSRRSTGPGGRLVLDEDQDEKNPPRWTTHAAAFLKELYAKYSPSLMLENKGSIARDHLANERTYLAWLRTSLSMITVGVAITQLFRLQSTTLTQPTNELIKVSALGRPLGGSFIALGIMFLWLGTSRYFHSQTVLSYGQFPASRGSVILATVAVLALLLACFIIVVLLGRTK